MGDRQIAEAAGSGAKSDDLQQFFQSAFPKGTEFPAKKVAPPPVEAAPPKPASPVEQAPNPTTLPPWERPRERQPLNIQPGAVERKPLDPPTDRKPIDLSTGMPKREVAPTSPANVGQPAEPAPQYREAPRPTAPTQRERQYYDESAPPAPRPPAPIGRQDDRYPRNAEPRQPDILQDLFGWMNPKQRQAPGYYDRQPSQQPEYDRPFQPQETERPAQRRDARQLPVEQGPIGQPQSDMTGENQLLPGRLPRAKGDLDLPSVVVIDKHNHWTNVLQNQNGQIVIVESFRNAVGRNYSSPSARRTVSSNDVDPVYVPTTDVDATQTPVSPYVGNPRNPLGTRRMRLTGEGYYAMHGTNVPSSIGKDESHGCIRHNNADAERLMDYAKIGTPVYFTDDMQGTAILSSDLYRRK